MKIKRNKIHVTVDYRLQREWKSWKRYKKRGNKQTVISHTKISIKKEHFGQ